MSKQTKSIEAMKEFGPYLRILNAYKMGNFRRAHWRQVLENFLFFIRIAIIIAIFTITITNSCRYCYDFNFDLKIISLQLLGVTCAIELFFVCILLSGKTCAIENAIDFLQQIIEQSKYCIPKEFSN